MTVAPTKAMSLASTSGVPSAPHATPCTEYTDTASANGDGDGGTSVLEALDRLLGPMEADLNERADVAMLPTPPLNTPEAFSPPGSVFRVARGRGFSILGDRLTQLKLQKRQDSDYMSSNRSDVMSSKTDDTESMDGDGSSVGDRSTGNLSTPKHIRHKIVTSLNSSTPDVNRVTLGLSPLNPLNDENIHFSSKDLPVVGTVETANSSTQAVPGNDGSHTRGTSFETIKLDRGGVTENTTWAEEVEDSVERAILRLEQLAFDDYNINPDLSLEDHYKQRLQRLLTAGNRKFKLNVSYASKGSSSSSPMSSIEAPTEVSDEDFALSVPKADRKIAVE